MGNKLSRCLGSKGGLNCDCCRQDVGPSHEAENAKAVAATATATTTAKQAKLDLKARKAQVMQYLSRPKTPKMPEMPKGLDADTKRYLRMIWRRHRIWPLENTDLVKDLSEGPPVHLVPDVGPAHEAEIAIPAATAAPATAPASTPAKRAKWDLRARKAQLMQYLGLLKTRKTPETPKDLVKDLSEGPPVHLVPDVGPAHEAEIAIPAATAAPATAPASTPAKRAKWDLRARKAQLMQYLGLLKTRKTPETPKDLVKDLSEGPPVHLVPDVGPAHEAEIAIPAATAAPATAPASTPAKRAKWDLRARKAQLMQYLGLLKTRKTPETPKDLVKDLSEGPPVHLVPDVGPAHEAEIAIPAATAAPATAPASTPAKRAKWDLRARKAQLMQYLGLLKTRKTPETPKDLVKDLSEGPPVHLVPDVGPAHEAEIAIPAATAAPATAPASTPAKRAKWDLRARKAQLMQYLGLLKTRKTPETPKDLVKDLSEGPPVHLVPDVGPAHEAEIAIPAATAAPATAPASTPAKRAKWDLRARKAQLMQYLGLLKTRKTPETPKDLVKDLSEGPPVHLVPDVGPAHEAEIAIPAATAAPATAPASTPAKRAKWDLRARKAQLMQYLGLLKTRKTPETPKDLVKDLSEGPPVHLVPDVGPAHEAEIAIPAATAAPATAPASTPAKRAKWDLRARKAQLMQYLGLLKTRKTPETPKDVGPAHEAEIAIPAATAAPATAPASTPAKRAKWDLRARKAQLMQYLGLLKTRKTPETPKDLVKDLSEGPPVHLVPDVGPAHEAEIAIPAATAAPATAPASTPAKRAKWDLRARKAQLMQYLGLLKTRKTPETPKGPVEDVQASADSSGEEKVTSDIVRCISFSGREMLFVFPAASRISSEYHF
ncbi:uncharacterized protein [Symphalangus syndactylus]|uniref:uncharacterized protein isoform X3 n=1 Tax=Symphalangus syndactylus TaxID=9590 RepID=UPI00300513F8